MEYIGDILAPHHELIAKIASTVTCMQFLSGIFIIKGDHAPDPFIGGVVLSLLGYKLGLVMDNDAMIRTNLVGVGINGLFTLLFYIFATSQRRRELWKKSLWCTLFTILCLAYSHFEATDKIEFRFGMIITAILVALVGAPLLNLGTIIRTRSTAGLPFPLILTGSFVAGCWALYGLSIRNHVLVLQNLFLLTLSAVQLSLFVIYPSSSAAKSNASKTKSNNNVKDIKKKKK